MSCFPEKASFDDTDNINSGVQGSKSKLGLGLKEARYDGELYVSTWKVFVDKINI